MSQGWMGSWGQLRHAVRTVGGDYDTETNQPVVTGCSLFLGIVADSNDVVVHGEAQYFIAGMPQSLPLLLNSTSYGLRNVEVY